MWIPRYLRHWSNGFQMFQVRITFFSIKVSWRILLDFQRPSDGFIPKNQLVYQEPLDHKPRIRSTILVQQKAHVDPPSSNRIRTNPLRPRAPKSALLRAALLSAARRRRLYADDVRRHRRQLRRHQRAGGAPTEPARGQRGGGFQPHRTSANAWSVECRLDLLWALHVPRPMKIGLSLLSLIRSGRASGLVGQIGHPMMSW